MESISTRKHNHNLLFLHVKLQEKSDSLDDVFLFCFAFVSKTRSIQKILCNFFLNNLFLEALE